MSVKPTKYRKKTQKPLPEYEILTEEEGATTAEADCCICDNPGTSWCNPENTSGMGSVGTSMGAQNIGYWIWGK